MMPLDQLCEAVSSHSIGPAVRDVGSLMLHVISSANCLVCSTEGSWSSATLHASHLHTSVSDCSFELTQHQTDDAIVMDMLLELEGDTGCVTSSVSVARPLFLFLMRNLRTSDDERSPPT